MEKKLTKKELKEMEEVQKAKVNERKDVISSVKQFWGDVAATERYFRINNMKDKLTYSGNVIDEEEEKILRQYKALDFLNLHYDKNDNDYRVWDFIRMMKRSQAEYENYTDNKALIVDKKYLKDGIWNDDIVWDEKQLNMYLRYAKRFGYQYFITTDSSTAALRTIAGLVKRNAKAVGVCTTEYYQDEDKGIIFDISDVVIDEDTTDGYELTEVIK